MRLRMTNELPARNDIESERQALAGTLERLRPVKLERDVAEQHPQAAADAQRRHSVRRGGVGRQLPLRRGIRPPGDARVAEEEQLGGQEAGRQAELARTE